MALNVNRRTKAMRQLFEQCPESNLRVEWAKQNEPQMLQEFFDARQSLSDSVLGASDVEYEKVKARFQAAYKSLHNTNATWFGVYKRRNEETRENYELTIRNAEIRMKSGKERIKKLQDEITKIEEIVIQAGEKNIKEFKELTRKLEDEMKLVEKDKSLPAKRSGKLMINV